MWPRLLLTILLYALGSAVAVPASAQTPAQDAVEEVRAAYQRLDYEAARTLARAALADATLRLDQRVDLHTILALVAFTRNDPEEARRQFGLALDLDPGLTLDPLLVSPKILDFLEEVKRARTPPAEAAGSAEVRYVVVRDVRAEAALRSMVVPGWGQLHKGERTKGWVLAGLWAASASGSLYAHLRWADARRAYLDERDPGRVAARHDASDAWYKARNNLLLGAAAVWLVSYVDALAGRHAPPQRLASHPVLGVAPGSEPGLYVRFRF